jgi:hypothetical protein
MRIHVLPRIGFGIVVLFMSGTSVLPGHPLPNKWDIQISVEVKGRYGLEGRDSRFAGSFAFTGLWVGLMEKDDEDYLLLHKDNKLELWEAEEHGSAEGRLVFLKTDDFAEKPELRVNYILREKDGLHIDFLVTGFDVPRASPTDNFRLALPAAAENSTNTSGVRYDLYIASGSNRIVLREAAIAKGPDVVKFEWTWTYRTWIQKSDQTVLITQSHNAVVTVAVTPHEEDPSARREGGIYRKPGAGAPG